MTPSPFKGIACHGPNWHDASCRHQPVREPHCTVGICRRPATRGPWCAEHYGFNNGD